MKLNKTDYVLERAADGGYYAWLTGGVAPRQGFHAA